MHNKQLLQTLHNALSLSESDMPAIFEEGGAVLSSSEFSALFRREKNKHFRPCSDDLLQSFLAGLSPSPDE